MCGISGIVHVKIKIMNWFVKISISLAVALLAGVCALADEPTVYDEAKILYGQGMYEHARVLFEEKKDDPLCADYAILCALHLRTGDAFDMMRLSESTREKTMLYSEIHRLAALWAFDMPDYALSLEEFSKVDVSSLSELQKAEYWYKKGFCSFSSALVTQARECFVRSSEITSEYVYPAYFALGMLEYNDRDFASARSWFEKSVQDPRFEQVSSFYLTDCHFMARDYDYVITHGEKLYDRIPHERQRYLARLLSESYMVKGDAVKAKKYLSLEGEMSNADYFHAGSVLYAVGDYRGAIQNFENMTRKGDSLAQIAAYQKAYSYIQIKNKVKAYDGFKDASSLSYDAAIKEDAMFNYAKLAYDLNDDETVFRNYLKIYGLSKKGELIYDYMAMSALRRSDYARAVQAYDQIDYLSADQKSNYIKANFLRARELLSLGSNSAAIPYLKAAAYYLDKDDEFGQLCRYSLANTYYVTDAYGDALKVYDDLYNLSALSGYREGPLIPYNIAYCYFKQRNYQDAARWFDVYISSSDRLAREDALTRRADCDFSLKKYGSAARLYARAVGEYPGTSNLYPYYYMGVACSLSGDSAGRVKALSAALDASAGVPYYCQCMYELGRAYSDASDYVNALKVFDLLLSRTSDAQYVAKAMIGKGMVKKNKGDYEGALADFKALITKMPRSEYVSEALLSIQSTYTAMGQPEKYIDYLEANKISTGRTAEDKRSLYYSTAEQVFLAGNYSGAISSFRKYLSMFPDSRGGSEALYYMAASYKSLGEKEKACEFYKKALDRGLDGTFEEFALMDYASLLYSLQKYDDAYAVYMQLSSDKYTMTGKMDAYKGAMRSAYNNRRYDNTIQAAASLLKLGPSKDLRREAQFLQAKSYLSTSQRDKAFALLGKLISEPDTAEGAESYYLIIQARYDWGRFAEVEKGVFDFSSKCSSQPYWLAKAFIVLGDSYVERGMTEQARATYQSVIDGYEPSGGDEDIRTLASEKLAKLQEGE